MVLSGFTSGFEWFRVVSNGYEWTPVKTTQNHLKQHVSSTFRVVLSGCRSGFEWFRVVLSGFGWFRMVIEWIPLKTTQNHLIYGNTFLVVFEWF